MHARAAVPAEQLGHAAAGWLGERQGAPTPCGPLQRPRGPLLCGCSASPKRVPAASPGRSTGADPNVCQQPALVAVTAGVVSSPSVGGPTTPRLVPGPPV